MTLASGPEPVDITDEMRLIERTPPDASDVRTLASAVTGMDLVVGSDSEALLLEYAARREFDPCESSWASRIRLTGRRSKGPAWISSTCRGSSSGRYVTDANDSVARRRRTRPRTRRARVGGR